MIPYKLIDLLSTFTVTVSSSICFLMLTVSAFITVHKLCTASVRGSNNKILIKLFFIFKNKNHFFQFISCLLMIIIISCCIRSGVYCCLGLHRADVHLYTFILIIFSTWLPVIYTFNILIQLICLI